MKRYLATCDDCPHWREIRTSPADADAAARRHAQSAHGAEMVRTDIDAFIRAHEHLARYYAHKAGLLPGETYDDVYADALVGLWDASRRWDPEKCTFTTFAAHRIAGEITDARRMRDPLSRRQREQGGYELALSLDVLVADGTSTLGDLVPDTVDPIAEWHEVQDTADGHDRLMGALEALPARQRHVIEGILAGRMLADLGADLDVTESRACQMKAAAIEKLRRVMVAA